VCMSQPPTVVLIDDNDNLLQAMVMALELLSDFHILCAHDGMEGLELILEAMPDCIVADIKMPRIDGIQLVQALRGDARTADIPIVMMTALAQDTDRFTGLAVGADIYLVKPVKARSLIAAIKSAIARTGQERYDQIRRLSELDDI
jgi:DNA-binding response OmpR family regulator